MRQSLVAGNWKLNGSTAGNESLLSGILQGSAEISATEVAVCPPFVYLPAVRDRLAGSRIGLGAQDVSDQEIGAFTGEVSAPMLKECGCRYVIVGHSERRHVYGEHDELTAAKFASASQAGLVPILCVGEQLDERNQGAAEAVVSRQLETVLQRDGIGAMGAAVIAYEPVWAIGTGETATPDQAQEMHAFIRNYLAARDAEIASGVRILYGGSVNAGNTAELFACADIDGGLIGGASLKADEFLAIARAAHAPSHPNV